MDSHTDETERIARLCRQVAETEPRLIGLYLFGSRTDGTAHERSDVDLGALFRERIGLGEVVGLEARFEDALRASVDLIDIGHSDPFLPSTRSAASASTRPTASPATSSTCTSCAGLATSPPSSTSAAGWS